MLPLFGAEGFRLEPFIQGRIDIGVTRLSLQLLLVVGVFAALVVALWLFFRFSILGKILRATSVNRIGARLVGISPDMSGAVAFGLASLIGCDLRHPDRTAHHRLLRFRIPAGAEGLRRRGRRRAGQLSDDGARRRSWSASLESFSSFYASALKESLVFAALIPILLYMSITHFPVAAARSTKNEAVHRAV